MKSSHKLLIVLLLALGGGLALGLRVLGGGASERSGPVQDGGSRALAPSESALSPVPEQRVERPTAAVRPDVPELEFVHPLKLELELLRARSTLVGEGAAPQGHGARARLRGNLYGPNGAGAPGELAFVAGANAGRVLQTDSGGAFGANDLYPGISVVEISAVGMPPAQRELRLRNGSEALLNLGFGRLSTVYGEVIDREGQPLPYATVTLDGQRATTDEQGVFYFPRVASGEVLVVVQKAGYASYRETLNVTAGRTIEIGKLRFALDKGATLQVTIQERVGGAGEALLFLEPDHDYKNPGVLYQRRFPWHLVSPVSIAPGGTVTLEDLPAMRVRLRLVHAGARAVPRTQSVDLVGERTKHVVLHLEPGDKLRGVVLKDGEPVHKAKVTLEVPDVAMATAQLMDGPIGVLEAGVTSNLPPAMQVVYTDGLGKFELSAAEELSKVRYLTATAPDGESWAGRVVNPGDREVQLHLERRVQGEVALRIESLPRKRPVALEAWIDGVPLDRPTVMPDEDLTIEGLVPGVWRVTARYRSQVLLSGRELELDGDEVSLVLDLPLELREGPEAVAGS